MEAEQQAPAGPGPGPRLRDGRLARGIDLDEAARRLKLNRAILERLERDDYSDLPAALYIRGYLAAYARLLEIPEQEVLEDFRRTQGESVSPALTAARSLGPQARSTDRGMRWFSYFLAMAVVGIAIYWGYERWVEDRIAALPSDSGAETRDAQIARESPLGGKPTETGAYIEAAEKPTSPLGPPADMGPVEPSNRLEAARSDETPSEAGAIPAKPIGPDLVTTAQDLSSAVRSEGGDAEATVSQSGDSLASELGGPQPPQEAEPAESSPPTTASALEQGDSQQAATGADRLELTFDRDCWVEIRDAEGERLAFGLEKSGTGRRYEGRAPFRILLGDSGGVSILYNEKLVDPETYGAADGRPARFTLSSADSPS